MRAAVAPGEDPMTLPTPEAVAETIVPLCLPGFMETGKIYDYRAGRLNSFRPPALANELASRGPAAANGTSRSGRSHGSPAPARHRPAR